MILSINECHRHISICAYTQAKLSGAGVSFSWNGPHQWSASLSFGRALGKTPSLLSGSSSLHTGAWLELVRKFN
jgi:hypothetical protein